MNEPGRMRIWWVSSVAITAALMITQCGFVIPMTPSIRPTLLIKDASPLHRGDYVNVSIVHPVIDAKRAVVLTKRVACMGGDELRFERNAHYCNGKYLGAVVSRTRDGVLLAPFVYNGRVPDGQLFLVGDHIRSFDSRYIGFVDARAIERLRVIF